MTTEIMELNKYDKLERVGGSVLKPPPNLVLNYVFQFLLMGGFCRKNHFGREFCGKKCCKKLKNKKYTAGAKTSFPYSAVLLSL